MGSCPYRLHTGLPLLRPQVPELEKPGSGPHRRIVVGNHDHHSQVAVLDGFDLRHHHSLIAAIN
jgi:hypothetical protein